MKSALEKVGTAVRLLFGVLGAIGCLIGAGFFFSKSKGLEAVVGALFMLCGCWFMFLFANGGKNPFKKVEVEYDDTYANKQSMVYDNQPIPIDPRFESNGQTHSSKRRSREVLKGAVVTVLVLLSGYVATLRHDPQIALWVIAGSAFLLPLCMGSLKWICGSALIALLPLPFVAASLGSISLVRLADASLRGGQLPDGLLVISIAIASGSALKSAWLLTTRRIGGTG